MSFEIPKSLKIFGFRMSTPTRITLDLLSDRTEARFRDRKVFPSPPTEDVIPKTLPLWFSLLGEMNFKLAPSARKASLTDDLGFSKTTKFVLYFECGAIPKTGIEVYRAMSSFVRILVFNAFKTSTTLDGNNNPSSTPNVILNLRFGPIGL